MKILVLACVTISLFAFDVHVHAQSGNPKQHLESPALQRPIHTVMRSMSFLCAMDNVTTAADDGLVHCGYDPNKPEGSNGGGGGDGGISCTDNTDAENSEVAAPTCSITDPGSSSPAVTVGPGSSWGNIPNCNSLTEVTASTNCISDQPDTSGARAGDDACALQLAANLQRCEASRTKPTSLPHTGHAPYNDCVKNTDQIFEMCEKNMPNGGGDIEASGAGSKMVAVNRNAHLMGNKCNDLLRTNFHYCSRLNNRRAKSICTSTAELVYIQCDGLPIPARALKNPSIR